MERSQPLRRRTPMKSAPVKPRRPRPDSIRALRPDEPIPDVPARRFKNGDGYIRLRWKIAPHTYVEEYEHRVVMGRPEGMDVHHENGIKDDNRPENLIVLTPEEHQALHARMDALAAEAEGWPEWKRRGFRCEEAARKHDQRIARQKERAGRVRQMADLYRQGMSTTEIGLQFGVDSSNVSRALRSAGIQMREFASQPKTPKAERLASQERILARSKQVVHSRSRQRCERCSINVTWRPSHVHHRKPRALGGSSDPAIHSPANLLHLCVDCHVWVESNRTEALSLGLLVPQAEDPATKPVQTIHGLVILLDDGEVRDAA